MDPPRALSADFKRLRHKEMVTCPTGPSYRWFYLLRGERLVLRRHGCSPEQDGQHGNADDQDKPSHWVRSNNQAHRDHAADHDGELDDRANSDHGLFGCLTTDAHQPRISCRPGAEDPRLTGDPQPCGASQGAGAYAFSEAFPSQALVGLMLVRATTGERSGGSCRLRGHIDRQRHHDAPNSAGLGPAHPYSGRRLSLTLSLRGPRIAKWPQVPGPSSIPLPGFEAARRPVTAAVFAHLPMFQPLENRSEPPGTRSRLWRNRGATARKRDDRSHARPRRVGSLSEREVHLGTISATPLSRMLL